MAVQGRYLSEGLGFMVGVDEKSRGDFGGNVMEWGWGHSLWWIEL